MSRKRLPIDSSSSRPRGSSEVGSGGSMREDRLGEAAHLDHRPAVLVVGFRIETRMPRDFAAGLVVIVDTPQVVAARHRRERAVERQQLHAVAGQVEVADDLRPQQRHHVRRHRELEAGEHLFGDRRATEHVTTLEHEHLASCARQVGRTGQAVVAAADDDRVILHSVGRAPPQGAPPESILSTCRSPPLSTRARFSCARASIIVTGPATTR